MTERDQVVEILRKAISPPFKAVMGRGDGVVVVDGRPGYVWCRKLGKTEMLMEAYNRGAPNIEDVIVLVQESRIEGVKGYEVIGVASSTSPDNYYPEVPPHAWTHEWRPGLGRDRVTIYPRAWGYLRAEPIATGSMNVWVTPGWYYYEDYLRWYGGGYSPAFYPPPGGTRYQLLSFEPSDESLHITNGSVVEYGFRPDIPTPSGCTYPIAAVESTGTFAAVTENMIEDVRLFMDPIEDCGTGTALGAVEIEEDDIWILDATILNFEGGGGKVVDEGGGKATIDITGGGAPTGVSYCNIQWHVDGPLQTGTEIGEARLAPPGFDMLGAWMYCKNPGTAGTTTVDINKNDVTIFTVQANRPALPWNDPDNKIKGGALGVTTLVEGDKLSMDIDGVATGVEDLDVLLILGATGTGPAGLGLIEIQEDDVKKTDASIINFEGGGGKVTDEGAGKVTVDITPGAGGGAWTLIEDVELAAPAATIDFQNIPDTYKHLHIIFSLRTDRAASEIDVLGLRFNNSAVGYDWVRAREWDEGTAKDSGLNDTEIELIHLPATNSQAGSFSAGTMDFPDYLDTGKMQSVRVSAGMMRSAAAVNFFITSCFGQWRTTDAITRITLLVMLGTNFIAGSRASLYGIS